MGGNTGIGIAIHLSQKFNWFKFVGLVAKVGPCDYNHAQRQWRHSPKKTCFVKRASFSTTILMFQPPLPFLMLQPRDSIHGAYCKLRGRAGYRQKMCFFKNYGRTPIESVCLLKCVNTFVYGTCPRDLLQELVPSCVPTLKSRTNLIHFITPNKPAEYGKPNNSKQTQVELH